MFIGSFRVNRSIRLLLYPCMTGSSFAVAPSLFFKLKCDTSLLSEPVNASQFNER